MENFNRRSSHGHHGSKSKHLRTGATSTLMWIAHIHSHTYKYSYNWPHLHEHGYKHLVRSASSAMTEFGIKFYVEGTWGRGSKPLWSSLVNLSPVFGCDSWLWQGQWIFHLWYMISIYGLVVGFFLQVPWFSPPSISGKGPFTRTVNMSDFSVIQLPKSLTE